MKGREWKTDEGQGWTEKSGSALPNQQQEPEPSQDATVREERCIWVDDAKPSPDADYAVARTYDDALALLRRYDYDRLFLDHDLGDDGRTGLHLLRQLRAEGRVPRRVDCISWNPVGRKAIEDELADIRRATDTLCDVVLRVLANYDSGNPDWSPRLAMRALRSAVEGRSDASRVDSVPAVDRSRSYPNTQSPLLTSPRYSATTLDALAAWDEARHAINGRSPVNCDAGGLGRLAGDEIVAFRALKAALDADRARRESAMRAAEDDARLRLIAGPQPHRHLYGEPL